MFYAFFLAWQTMNVDMCKYSLTHAGQAMARDLVCTNLHTVVCTWTELQMQMLHTNLEKMMHMHDNTIQNQDRTSWCWGLVRVLKRWNTSLASLTCLPVSDAGSVEEAGVWTCWPWHRVRPAHPSSSEAGWTLLQGLQGRACDWWTSGVKVAGGSCWCGRSWGRYRHLPRRGGRLGQGWRGPRWFRRNVDRSCHTGGEEAFTHGDITNTRVIPTTHLGPPSLCHWIVISTKFMGPCKILQVSSKCFISHELLSHHKVCPSFFYILYFVS